MKPKELPDDIRAKVSEWTGGTMGTHFWEDNGIYYVVTISVKDGDVYCLRLWRTPTSIVLSQDNVLFI